MVAAAIGDALVEASRGAQKEILLVAPYVKRAALERLLAACKTGVRVNVVTRWRLEELQSGISDLDAWEVLARREESCWWNHRTLHAKYYRLDERVFIGSANLTGAGMGWGGSPNLETLIDVSPIRTSLGGFESAMFRDAVSVDDSLYALFQRALVHLPVLAEAKVIELTSSIDAELGGAWRPHLRFPADLYRFYADDVDDLTQVARESAAVDLAAFNPPRGLSERAFEGWVGVELCQKPEVRALEEFATHTRRFGEMRDFLRSQGDPEPDLTWQAWLRWLKHFLPDRYVFSVPNYSELFAVRRGRSTTPG